MTTNDKTLSMEDAKAMSRAAEAFALQIGMPFSMAVVDSGGHLLHFTRGDGVAVGCADLAINKAYTAVAFGQATADLARLAQPGATLFGIQHSLGGRAVIFGGGIPVLSKCGVMGAVGVSAGTVEQDVAVALAAIAALETDAAPTGPAGHHPD
jgi:uncharacterized protein GlcG (DUF336 family)